MTTEANLMEANPTNLENADDMANNASQSNGSRLELKKELGLLDGVAIIIGVIVGSGIFVSPKGVLLYSGSIGLGIIVWILSGVLSMIGALCYAELGTMILKSGGDYAYLNEAFGGLPAFLYMWSALLVIMPTGNAITALTFSQYILQPIWTDCHPPLSAIRLFAATITCLLTAINCYNVKWVAKVQDVFTLTKVAALVLIIIAGFWSLSQGNVENLQEPFRGSNFDPGHISLAFYSGIFSFAGWNYLNFVTEEIKNPYKNLPRAIMISMPVVIAIYVMVNAAYFIVLTKHQILNSDAVAVTFGDKMLGYLSWTIPIFVACSTFGSLNGNIFTSSRLFFVGAQHGHLPQAIALINVKTFTPIPSLVFLCLLTLILLFVKDVETLINYATFVESLFTLISVAGLLWMRRTLPKAHRPIKVNIVLPIVFFIICAFLVTLPFYVTPWEVGIGFIIILSGIPVYLLFIAENTKSQLLASSSDKLNSFCSKLFVAASGDRHVDDDN